MNTYTNASKVDYATGTNPQSVTTADFNGDNKPDLAVASYYSNTVSAVMNIASMATITFNRAYGVVPRVILTPGNMGAAGLKIYNFTTSSTSFTIDTAITPTNSTTNKFNYLIVQ